MSRLDWKRPKVIMPENKRRIALTISYDGNKWHGWQVQDNADSVLRRSSHPLQEKIFFSKAQVERTAECMPWGRWPTSIQNPE